MKLLLPALFVVLGITVGMCPAAVAGSTVVAAEYFLNTDPGPGNGSPVGLTAPSSPAEFSFSLPESFVAAMPDGPHVLGVRVLDDNGRWSLAHTRYFYKSALPNPAPDLVAVEYFFDIDPGQGNGTLIPIQTPEAVIDLAVEVPPSVLASLTDGPHRLVVRTMDMNGRWSLAATRHFYKSQALEEDEPRITRIEYQWLYSGTPVSPIHSIETNSSDNPVILEELAPMEDFVEGRTYQLVFTPFDGSGRRGVSFTHDVLYQPVSIFPPSLSGPTATDITSTSATLGGTVNDDGGAMISERGIVYSDLALNSNPVIDGPGVTKVATTGNIGSFGVNASGLIHGTAYAFKIYAINSEGTAYSSVATFTTDTNLNFGLDGIATVADRAIGVGETQKFRFTLNNPRAVNLAIPGVIDLGAKLLDDRGNVVANYNGSDHFDLDMILPVGPYELQITNLGFKAETFSMTIDASRVAEARPLLTVSARQLVSMKLKKVKAIASVSNVGNLRSSMLLRGTRGNSRFKVVYTYGGNVTSAMGAGTLTTAALGVGDAPAPVKVSVSPNRKKLKKNGRVIKKTFKLQIKATAAASPSRSESTSIRVRTR